MTTTTSSRDDPLPLESATISRSTTLNVTDEVGIDAAFALQGADLNADDDLIHWEVALLPPIESNYIRSLRPFSLMIPEIHSISPLGKRG
jgi:hypothetical protein